MLYNTCIWYCERKRCTLLFKKGIYCKRVMSHLLFFLFTHRMPQELHILCPLTYVPLLMLSLQHKRSFLFLSICTNTNILWLSSDVTFPGSLLPTLLQVIAPLISGIPNPFFSFTLLIKRILYAYYCTLFIWLLVSIDAAVLNDKGFVLSQIVSTPLSHFNRLCLIFVS